MEIGDKVTVWITGTIGDREAEIIDIVDGKPHLRVLSNPDWPILRPGDYLIRRSLTEDYE